MIGAISHPDLGVIKAYVCVECGAQVHLDAKEPPTEKAK